MDSGATHSFILQATVDCLKLKPKPHHRLWVTEADRKSSECENVVSVVLLLGTGMGNGCLQLLIMCYMSVCYISDNVLYEPGPLERGYTRHQLALGA